jgi:hypothetical protein
MKSLHVESWNENCIDLTKQNAIIMKSLRSCGKNGHMKIVCITAVMFLYKYVVRYVREDYRGTFNAKVFIFCGDT